MSTILLVSIVTITLALVFYTIGVWSEHKSKKLKISHLVMFWLGLCMDTTGTTLMTRMADHAGSAGISLHGITGAIAILLMIVHAVWATIVLVRHDEKASQSFHKFSLLVWIIWLIPYILGMVIGMG